MDRAFGRLPAKSPFPSEVELEYRVEHPDGHIHIDAPDFRIQRPAGFTVGIFADVFTGFMET